MSIDEPVMSDALFRVCSFRTLPNRSQATGVSAVTETVSKIMQQDKEASMERTENENFRRKAE